MYLVELRPGKEELYRTVDELAAAIRSGDVDVHSRIFHRATSKWISITLHPQFKAISAAREEHAEPRKQWTFLNSASDELGSARAEETETADPYDRHDRSPAPPAAEPGSTGHEPSGSWRRPIAFGVAGFLLVLGAQIAASGPRPHWSDLQGVLPSFLTKSASSIATAAARPSAARPAAEVETVRSSVVSLAGTTDWSPVAYPLPDSTAVAATPVSIRSTKSLPPVTVPDSPAHQEPAAAESNAQALAVDTLLQQYAAAYDEAHDRLAHQLQAIEFHDLFAPAHLASAGDIAQARTRVTGARRAIQAYRARAEEIERASQDTFATRSQELGLPSRQVLRWYARSRQAEPMEAQALSDALLATADSVFDLLAANAGAYAVRGASIEFDRPAATAEYGRLRQAMERYLDSASAEQAQALLTVAAILVKTGSLTAPPVEVSSR